MQFCKDCKFFKPRQIRVDWDTNIDYEKTVDKCDSPNLPLDLVYGLRHPIRAKDCRADSYLCAESAHWFEPADDLDDLSTIPFGRQA